MSGGDLCKLTHTSLFNPLILHYEPQIFQIRKVTRARTLRRIRLIIFHTLALSSDFGHAAVIVLFGFKASFFVLAALFFGAFAPLDLGHGEIGVIFLVFKPLFTQIYEIGGLWFHYAVGVEKLGVWVLNVGFHCF